MRTRKCLWDLLIPVLAAIAAAGAARSQSVPVAFADLTHMNTVSWDGDDLVIDQVDALEGTGYWYRYPWGYDVWDIQLQKNPGSMFISTEACLRVVGNPWASQTLHAFNGRLMRVGPATGPTYVATLVNTQVLPVPDFASRPGSLRFLTFGSHSGLAYYTVTLNHATGAPSVVVVPIASATVYPRDGSGSGWQTQAVVDFVSVCAGRYGDMVEVTNPRPSVDLTSIVIIYGSELSGPIAVSLSLGQSAYEAGYTFTGVAESGVDQQTALRTPAGSVTWRGIDWSATISDPHSAIAVAVWCGEAGWGGSISWAYAGSFDLTSGTGSADFAQPCSGEFVRCSIEMTAELATSPVLHSLAFSYGSATEVPGAMPAALRLYPNQPNPFNPMTTMKYDLPGAGPVRLAVFDLAGRLVRTLVDESKPQGSHEAVWDSRDASGREVGSGGYVARLEFGGKVETARMGLVR